MRRRVVAAMALAPLLLGSLLVAGPAQADDPGQAQQGCATAEVDGGLAFAEAARCGREVEITSRRSPWETVYATADGSTRLEVSSAATRTDVSGSWEPVDASLSAASDGIEVASAVNPMVFSDGSPDQPLARIESGDRALTFDVPFDLPAPTVVSNVLTYRDVLPGVDLVVSVDGDTTGFSEVLRVGTPEAAQEVADAGLTFPVEASADLDVAADAGGFSARASDGEVVFSSPAPRMWDSSADASDDGVSVSPASEDLSADLAVEPEGGSTFQLLAAVAAEVAEGPQDPRADAPLPGDQVADMATTVSDDSVAVVPDEALLSSADTVWPVYIDPSVSGTRNEWTTIESGWPTSTSMYKSTDDEAIGRCDPAATADCSKVNIQRTVWEFDDLGTLGDLDANQVESATFAVNGTYSWSCSGSEVSEYRVPNISSGTTWDSSAAKWTDTDLSDYITRQTVVSRAGCGGDKEPGRVEFDATEAAVWAASGNHASVSIGLKAHTEASMPDSWQRFAYKATFSVTYNRPPSKPTSLSTTSPTTSCVTGSGRPYVRDATPLLRATLSDPDGDTVQGNFDVFRLSDGVQVSDLALTALQASGKAHTYQVASGELAKDGTYYWIVKAKDSGKLYGPEARCEFTLDTTKPAAPTVSVASGPYSNNGSLAGGVGTPGSFTFTDSSSDVAEYDYSFVDDAMTKTTTSTTSAYAPTQAGPVTLYVKAVDRAGNVSSTVEYTFVVSFTKASDKWLFNEASGIVAATQTSTGRSLTVTGSPARVAGSTGAADDLALQLGGTGTQYAQSAVPVVHTETGFAISAEVELAAAGTDKTRAVVAQAGASTAAFELGFRKSGCPASLPDGCWAFWRAGSDVASPITVIAASDEPVTTDDWVQLTGYYDAASKQMSVWVCEVDTRQKVVQSGPVAFTTPWASFGKLQVGRAASGSSGADPWAGAVDKVTTWDQIDDVDVDELQRDCQGDQAA